MLTEIALVAVAAFLATQVAIITTTVYLHRGLTHRSLTFNPVLGGIFRVLTWISTGIRPRQWVAVHRKHHAHTDTDADPHSPKLLGWKRVQLTNVWLYRAAASDPETVRKYAKDLPRTRLDRLLFDRAWLGLLLGLSIIVFAIGPVAGVIAWLIHVVAYIGLSGSINSIGHHFGRRPFQNSATNLVWLGILTGGEGLHNNHHAAPTSARFARRWYEMDFGWWVIRGATAVRLARVRHSDVDRLAQRAPVGVS